MRYVADLCIAALCGLAACQFGDNIIEPVDALGPRADIQECCIEWWLPFGNVQDCFDRLAEPDVCRYLNCDLVFTTLHYTSEACK